MSVKRTPIFTEELKLSGTDPVILNVIIGNGHIGSSVVKIKYSTETLGTGEIQDLPIGLPADLIGKTLRVVTRVLIASASKKIIVTHSMTNADPADSVYKDEVSDNHDVFTMVADYELVD